MQAKKEKQMKKDTASAGISTSQNTKTEAMKIETSKTEPVKVETSKTEPVKVETSKTEPIKVETSKTEPAKVGTSKTDPIKVGTSKTEPVKVETSKTEPINVGTSKTEPVKVETSKTEPIKVETSKTEPVKVETSKTEPIKVETSKTEPVMVETSRTEPAKVGTSKTEPLKVETQKEDTAYTALYEKRLNRYYNDLKWLYCELFRDCPDVSGYFDSLCKKMKAVYSERSLPLKKKDQELAFCPDWYRSATFTAMAVDPASFAGTLSNMKEKISYLQEAGADTLYLTALFQATANFSLKIRPELGTSEDLSALAGQCSENNIRLALEIPFSLSVDRPGASIPCVMETPAYFNAMVLQILELANQGVGIFSLGVLPCLSQDELWKLHSVLRMTRMVSEIVCPGILLLAETQRSQAEAAAFAGSQDMPELHIVSSTQLMSDIWHTVATRNTALLKKDLDEAYETSNVFFQNYLRNRNTVNWNLDYGFLNGCAMTEEPHRAYLNEFLSGTFPDSFARGGIYFNKETDRAELCGTTASLAGIERFDYEGNFEGVQRGIRYALTLHAFLLSLPGIPVLHSGDEIGQLNDYTYKADEAKASDPRWLHKGTFNWALCENRKDPCSIQGQIFNGLNRLEKIREEHSVFASGVTLRTIETWDPAIPGFVRETEQEKLICLYNFSETDKVAWINEQDGYYTDLFNDQSRDAQAVELPAFGSVWLLLSK